MKKNKNYTFGIGIFIFAVMYKLCLLNLAGEELRDSLTSVFGYINLNNEKNFIINFSLWVIPQLTVILIYGEYYKKELISNSSLILIRSTSRIRIMLKYILDLIKKVSIVIAFELLVTCFFSIIKGGKININTVLLMEIVSVFLYYIMLVLIINALSLYMNTTYTVCIVIFLEIIQVFFITKNIAGGNLLPVYGILYEIAGNRGQEVLPLVMNNIVWILIVIATTLAMFNKKKDII